MLKGASVNELIMLFGLVGKCAVVSLHEKESLRSQEVFNKKQVVEFMTVVIDIHDLQ